MISEDEIILMIKKGNEEALGLLFSLYETKMRYESDIFNKKYGYLSLDNQDFFQEMYLLFLDSIKRYNPLCGKFYSFFMIIMNRTINKMIYKIIDSDGISKSVCGIDNVSYMFKDEDKDKNSEYRLDYEHAFSFMNSKKGESSEFCVCLSLWSKGYSYNEITKITGLSHAQVNYFIRESLLLLKKHMIK